MPSDARKQVVADSAYALDELTLKLSMARGLDEVMEVVRRLARPLVRADGVTFVLRDNGMCHYADEDAISPLWKGQRFPMESCISGWAMLHGQTVVIEDIYADARIPHAAYRPTFVKSLAMVPVRQEDPIGAIGAYWAHRHVPSEGDLYALQRIANSAAVAMTNVALFQSLIAAKEEAERAKDAIILALASLAETRDYDTGDHIRRTQQYVRVLAEACLARGHGEDELAGTIELLIKSAPLHDIGKVGIPDSILLKAGPLDEAEFTVMKTHAELGRRAIAGAEEHLGTSSPLLRLAQEIAHTHHERWDGAGYPCGLKGADIPLSGRIMAVADVYDALVSKRRYKPALPHLEAVAIIAAERGHHFDPVLVDVFLEVARDFETIHRYFADG
jgi:HD-GYP domain-containing protein (c-di-GMP phosphodiesterase class II)